MIFKRYIPHIILLLIACIWGVTFPMGKYVIQKIPVFTYLGVRFALASLILFPLSFRSLKSMDAKSWRISLVIGFFLFLAFAFQTVGLNYTTASKVSFVTGLYVVLVPVLYYLIFGTPVKLAVIIGSILACIGLALLGGDFSGLTSWDLGVSLVVAAAVFTALQIVWIARYGWFIDSLALTFVQIFIVAICCLFVALTVETMPEKVGWDIVGCILFLSVFATVIAYFVQCRVQQQIGHTITAVIMSMEAVTGAALSWMWLGEKLSFMAVIGCLFMFAAMIITQMEPAPDIQEAGSAE